MTEKTVGVLNIDKALGYGISKLDELVGKVVTNVFKYDFGLQEGMILVLSDDSEFLHWAAIISYSAGYDGEVVLELASDISSEDIGWLVGQGRVCHRGRYSRVGSL